MKIGDRVYVHGRVDEIRKDIVIIRNKGGYFGTVPSEIVPGDMKMYDKRLIQKFHDYQVEWLKAHCDIELEPQLEELIIRYLHDTANCYMMEDDEPCS